MQTYILRDTYYQATRNEWISGHSTILAASAEEALAKVQPHALGKLSVVDTIPHRRLAIS